MSKKSNKQKVTWAFKYTAAILAVLMIGAAGAWYAWSFHPRQERADVFALSELIVRAAEGTKADAPVDPKSGDIYFPQARLFVPMQASTVQLTYAYDSAGGTAGSQPQLDVSSKSIFDQNAATIYEATDTNAVFKRVPKLQACQRGVHLTYDKLAGEDEPAHIVHLNNGKELYIYIEKSCPELSEVAEMLKGIQAY